MKRMLWTGTGTAAMALAAATLFGQTTTPSSPAQTASPGSDKKITVTGCLKSASDSAAPASAVGTSGAAGTAGTAGTTGTAGAAGAASATPDASSDAKFLLTDASISPVEASGAPSAAGAPAAAASSGTKQTYRLVANPAALTPHVGKKLELTGTLEEPNSAGQPSETTSGDNAAGPKLRVEAGKVVAASCSEQ
jgi:pilus assembly protein FimV